MTDKKEIIIDGVDVSECCYLHTSVFNEKKFLCDAAQSVGENCFTSSNCYFKQLQCKTQECNDLKIQLHSIEILSVPKVELNRYKQALDEIEKIITKMDADECAYGDFDCENCNSDGKCDTAAKRTVLDIISKAKRFNND